MCYSVPVKREKAFVVNVLRPLLLECCEDCRMLEVRGTLGVPDLLILRGGVPGFVEVKFQERPGRAFKLSGAQVSFLNACPRHSWLLVGFPGDAAMVWPGEEVRYGMRSRGGLWVPLTAEALAAIFGVPKI